MSASVDGSEPLGLRRPARLVWITAICFAATLHAAGFALAWRHMALPEEDDALGAPAIEIGLELTAPHQEETELPPGPEADASAASSAAVQQTAKAEQTDLPKETPTETDDPDRLVAPDATKKLVDEKPTVTESKANPAMESVASEATAPPNVEAAHEAPRSVAPAQGSGESLQRIKTTWQKELVAHLNRFKRYPPGPSRRAVAITVTFALDRMGHVVSASIQKSSGDAAFDQAALDMMRHADPVPQPPPRVADEGLAFTLPVIFRDKRK